MVDIDIETANHASSSDRGTVGFTRIPSPTMDWISLSTKRLIDAQEKTVRRNDERFWFSEQIADQ